MLWLAALALAGDVSTLQAVHELEWRRDNPVSLAAQVPGGDRDAREAVAVALGRLRDERALSPLLDLADDPDPAVRAAVAFALGATPGSLPALRERIAREPRPRGLADRAAAADGVLVRLIEALGRRGDETDVPLLVAELTEPWPVGAAAARALGRLGRRGIDARAAAPALARALARPDPRLVEAAAWALRSVGLAEAPPDALAAARRGAIEGPTGPTRAFLVSAVWPELGPDERGDLFVRAVTDPWRATRVAALDAVGPGDMPVVVLASWLSDADPWLVDGALRAIGRAGDEGLEVLERVAIEETDPWLRARAVALGAQPQGDEEVVRAASVRRLTDRAELLRIATEDPSAMRRTAAVDALDALGPDPELGRALLRSSDPAVREAAVAWLADDDAGRAELIRHLRTEKASEVVLAGLKVLDARPAPLDASEASLLNVLKRTARGGSAVPSIEEAGRIRAARVITDAGSFTIALDPDTAPFAVANFARLAEDDFYDGLVFHRVVPGFVAQTGCPRGDGWGGPGYTIPDEPSALPFDVGAVGMARADYDTGGSQWFVSTGPAPHLVGEYTRFGQVTQGLEVVARLRRGGRILDVVVERAP